MSYLEETVLCDDDVIGSDITVGVPQAVDMW